MGSAPPEAVPTAITITGTPLDDRELRLTATTPGGPHDYKQEILDCLEQQGPLIRASFKGHRTHILAAIRTLIAADEICEDEHGILA